MRVLLALVLVLGLPFGCGAQPSLSLRGTGDAVVDANFARVRDLLLRLQRGIATVNVLDYGAIADCQAGVGTDNCPYFTAAVNALPPHGGTIGFPDGDFCTSCAVSLRSGSIYVGMGSGQVNGTNGGATEIQQLASTPVGFNLMQAEHPSVCSGVDPTTCESAIGVAKGGGCICHSDADCVSGTCLAGTSSHGVTVRDLTLRLFHDYSTAISFQNVGEGLIEHVGIGSQVDNPTETHGVLFSDTAGTVSGYVDRLRDSHMEAEGTNGLTFGVRVLNSANRIIIDGNRIQTNVGICVQTEAHGTVVTDNTCESFSVAGYKDTGIATVLERNYAETGAGGLALPRVLLSPAPTQSRYATVRDMHFMNGNANALIVAAGSLDPMVFPSKGDVTDLSGRYGSFGTIPYYEGPTTPPNASAWRTCTGSLGVRGAKYIDSSLSTAGVECRCAPWGGVNKWCPSACTGDGLACPELGGAACAGSATDCG